MSRADDLYGSNDVNALFQDKPLTQTPWGQATRSKTHFDYDKEKVVAAVREHLHSPRSSLQQVDPRTLSATQPAVTRGGVSHYMRHDPDHAPLYGDSAQGGNVHPVVYKRDDGHNLLLSGTHRGAAALLQGRQLDAVVVEGGWGHAR